MGEEERCEVLDGKMIRMAPSPIPDKIKPRDVE